MKMRPLGNQLILKRDKSEERTPSGLTIPDSAKKNKHRGTVVAAGPGAMSERGERMPMSCAEGDVVLFAPGAGVDVSVDGEDYLVVSEDAVIAVVS